MSRPLISVIMPAYKAERTIEQSINSLRDCGTKDFELIVVDDGSPDPVEPYVRRAADGMKWRCIRGSENRGIATAGNLAISIANGLYIARLDADDICVNERMKKQIEFLEADQSMAFCGTHYQCFGSNSDLKIMPTTPEACFGGLAVGCQFANSSTLIHRERAGDELYYDPTMASEDYDLWLRLCMSGRRGVNLPLVGLMYRVSPGSYVSNNKKKTDINDFSIRLRAIKNFIVPSSGMRPLIIASVLSARSPFKFNNLEYCSAIKSTIDLCEPKKEFITEWNLFVEYIRKAFPVVTPNLSVKDYADWCYRIVSSTRRFRHSD